MSQPFKVCPSCGQHLALHMLQCGRCKALQPMAAPSAPVFRAPAPVVNPLGKRSPVLMGIAGFVGVVMLFGLWAGITSPKPAKRHVRHIRSTALWFPLSRFTNTMRTAKP